MKLLRRKQRSFLISSIALVLLIGFLWVYIDKDTTPSLVKVKSSKEPDFFMRNMRTLNYDQTGQLEQTLTANKLDSYSKGKRSNLQNPAIDLYHQQTEPTWQITAKSGIVRNQGNRVDLNKNVVIHNTDNSYQLNTEALTVYPEKNIAENNKLTTILSPQGTTTAQGIKTDLNQEHTILKNNVTGQYNAQH